MERFRANLKIGGNRQRSVPGEDYEMDRAPKSHGALAILLTVLVLLAAFVVAAPYVPGAVKDGSDLLSQLVSSLGGSTGPSTNQNLNYTIYSPLIQDGAANISYPPDYSVLSTYALGLINTDRNNYTLANVTLTSGTFAQQHADSMLLYGYFSHNDTQGLEPYMRYTLLGGNGSVEENIAYAYTGSPQFTSTASIESAMKSLEHTMMYNDLICCNNGHRDNILTALHNEVSIGVAYNATRVYFVEDFIDYYINLNFSTSSSFYVTMTGTPIPQMSGLSPYAVYISYDPTPIPETPAQLNSGPHAYSPGVLLGGVLPPCDLSCQDFTNLITVHADTWVFTSDQVSVAFSLSDFIASKGAGVYTVYLVLGENTSTAITSICVFVASP